MNEKVIYRLIDTSSFSLKLNEKLPKFTLISGILEHNNIPFQSWNPDAGLSFESIEMSFSLDCKFQDVYLLAYLLKDYGLETVYPSRKSDGNISLGTYLTGIGNRGKYAVAAPIRVEDLLDIDPKLNTKTVVDNFFKCHFADNEIDDLSEDNYQEGYDDDYDERENHMSNNDYDRDTFDALTDGQYGSYDDWRENGGDFDNLRDGLGY